MVVSALNFFGLGIERFGPQHGPYQTLLALDREGREGVPGHPLPVLNIATYIQEGQNCRPVVYGEVRGISSN